MPSSGPGPADHELAAELTRRGYNTTARQVERYREDGRITPPRKRGRGRGLGSFSVYEADAVAHAEDFVRQLKLFKRADEATLIVFLHGFPVRQSTLRRSYGSVFDRIDRTLNSAGSDNLWEAAASAAESLSHYSSRSPTGTEMRRRMKDAGAPELFTAAIHDLTRFALGDARPTESLSEEALTSVGARDLVNELSAEDRSQFDALTRSLSLPALRGVTQERGTEDLDAARQSLVAMTTLFSGARLHALQDEWVLAVVGIPATVVAGSLIGATLAQGLAAVLSAE